MKRSNQGFTLVELAIVLVIIGLIVGGIISGQEMIRSASLKSDLRAITQYATATNTFRDKYGDLPGDIPIATDFSLHQINGVNTACQTGAGPSFNGNGNGTLEDFGDTNIVNNGEMANFWFHLANSALITLPIKTDGSDCTDLQLADEFYPKLEAGGGIIAVSSTSQLYFILGRGSSQDPRIDGLGNIGSDEIFPIDAFYLDQKIDDANPLTNQMIVTNNYQKISDSSGIVNVDTDDSATNCIFNGSYNTTYEAASCTLGFRAQ